MRKDTHVNNIKLGLFPRSFPKAGFTLVELLVVIVILGILASAAIITLGDKSEAAKHSVDLANVRMLNGATELFLMDRPANTLFSDPLASDEDRLSALVDNNYVLRKPLPQVKGNSFLWSIGDRLWVLEGPVSGLLKIGEITWAGSSSDLGWISNYSGTATDIVIPKELEGILIKQIQQDTFAYKGLNSIVFSPDSEISRIHRHAFRDNNLSELVLPPSVTRIDGRAFLNNPNLTRVSIGAGVTLEENVFRNNDLFKTYYETQDSQAGTYVYDGTNWTKLP